MDCENKVKKQLGFAWGNVWIFVVALQGFIQFGKAVKRVGRISTNMDYSFFLWIDILWGIVGIISAWGLFSRVKIGLYATYLLLILSIPICILGFVSNSPWKTGGLLKFFISLLYFIYFFRRRHIFK